jgi:cell fate (sporulation/competence/biofilm development) regulator YmcA (YheA/YmcA/DUF963 family)
MPDEIVLGAAEFIKYFKRTVAETMDNRKRKVVCISLKSLKPRAFKVIEDKEALTKGLSSLKVSLNGIKKDIVFEDYEKKMIFPYKPMKDAGEMLDYMLFRVSEVNRFAIQDHASADIKGIIAFKALQSGKEKRLFGR